MKTILIAISLYFLSTPISPAEEIWGGKWDNTWILFFEIDNTKKPAQIIYRWEENEGKPMQQKLLSAKENKGTITVGTNIYLKLSGNKGIAFGDFTRPRISNLVRLKVKKLEDANESALYEAKWEGIVKSVAEIRSEILPSD